MLLALPPSLLSSSSSPLSVDHGNVIMHGNISQDGYCGKKVPKTVVLIINSSMFFPLLFILRLPLWPFLVCVV